MWHLGKGLTVAGVVAGVLKRPEAPAAALAEDPPYCIWCGATTSPHADGRNAVLQRIGEGWNFHCHSCKMKMDRRVRRWVASREKPVKKPVVVKEWEH